MSEDVIFGGDDDQESLPEDDTDDNQEQTQDNQDNPGGNEEDPGKPKQETMNDQSKQQNEQEHAYENSVTKVVTLGAVSSGNRSIMRAEDETWIPYDKELSKVGVDDMESRLESLQDNKDVWNGPIKIEMVNKGSMDEPEVRFLDYEIPDAEDVPEDFDPVERDDDDGSSSSGGSSSGEVTQLGSIDKDKAIAILQEQTDGDFTLETNVMCSRYEGDDVNLVKAILVIGENRYTAMATDEDSAIEQQQLEVAETRAYKRAIVFSGVLTGGEE